MPTYTYRCTKCGSEFEVVQRMSDPPLKRCRHCRGVLRRTFHPVGIVLKGSGFHRTDYRTSKPSSDGEAEKKGSSAAEKKESSPGEKEGSSAVEKKESSPGELEGSSAAEKKESSAEGKASESRKPSSSSGD